MAGEEVKEQFVTTLRLMHKRTEGEEEDLLRLSDRVEEERDTTSQGPLLSSRHPQIPGFSSSVGLCSEGGRGR